MFQVRDVTGCAPCGNSSRILPHSRWMCVVLVKWERVFWFLSFNTLLSLIQYTNLGFGLLSVINPEVLGVFCEGSCVRGEVLSCVCLSTCEKAVVIVDRWDLGFYWSLVWVRSTVLSFVTCCEDWGGLRPSAVTAVTWATRGPILWLSLFCALILRDHFLLWLTLLLSVQVLSEKMESQGPRSAWD